jgi:hypothetical protein
MLAKDIEQHIQRVIASVPSNAPAYISRAKAKRLLMALGRRLSNRKLPGFAEAINSAILEYGLRLTVERASFSNWISRCENLLAALRKLRPLLPDREQDELVFGIISNFGEGYAASHGPHPDLPPYELEDPLEDFPFTVNYRSSERIEQVARGVKEIADWIQSYLEAKTDEIQGSPSEELPAAVWLIGYELPRLYEAFFNSPFGVSLSAKGYGPGVHFIIEVLDAVGILAASGKRFSPHTIRAYRRRALKRLSKIKS